MKSIFLSSISVFDVFVVLFLSLQTNTADANEGNCKLCLSAKLDNSQYPMLIEWKISNCGERTAEFFGAELPWMPPPFGAVLSADVISRKGYRQLGIIYEFVSNREFIALSPGQSLRGETNLDTAFPMLRKKLENKETVVIKWRWKTPISCEQPQRIFHETLTVKSNTTGKAGGLSGEYSGARFSDTRGPVHTSSNW
jgi:hypothetical protein